MEITQETLYWITRLDGINAALAAALVVCALCAFVTGATALSDRDKLFGCVAFLSSGLTVMLLGTLVLVPTTKEAYLIYGVPAIVNSETVQEESADVYQLLKRYLESRVEEQSE